MCECVNQFIMSSMIIYFVFPFSGLVLFSLVMYSFALWTTEIFVSERGNQWCSPSKKYYGVLSIAGYIDMVITLVLPSFIIVIVNIRIVYALVSSRDTGVGHKASQGNGKRVGHALVQRVINNA